MKLIYNIGIFLYVAAARIISPFNRKATLWIDGRKGWERSLREKVEGIRRIIWVHCASLGEFEQGRPVVETIKKDMPDYKIILTFFSSSGYEVRKNYSLADVICYLPADTPRNAERFVSILRPECAVFVKYEFWHNYISVLDKKGIPIYLISGIFRSSQPFFKWYGSFFRKMLYRFTHIFVQDQVSGDLLRGIGVNKITVAGDTRFDRVIRLTESAGAIMEIEIFRGEEKMFIAGSSWYQDEEIVAKYINSNPGRMKWVFAPHEVDRQNVERLEKLFTCKTVKFSEYRGDESEARVLILDNIGMLSSAYRYAYIALVGGGFGRGIHNVLEPACWGIPVMFGPRYGNFREAVELLKIDGARTFKTSEECDAILERWLSDESFYLKSAKAAALYVSENKGATAVIMREITSQVINNHCS